MRGKKCFPPNSNLRRQASGRRQWFVPSPSSGDTAVRVFHNPYQPMVIRADLAQGSSSPRRFSSYKHAHRTIFQNYAIGGCRVGLCQLVQQSHAPYRGLSSPRSYSSSVRLTVPWSNSSMKLLTLCLDLCFPDIEIAYFNAFSSAHILTVVCSGVGGREP